MVFVRRMVRLDLEEARSLASVFGNLDRKRTVLLMLFEKPGSKWDAKTRMSGLPKSYRISTASLYRNVDELLAHGFLQVVKGSERRSRGGATVFSYELTLKGIFAAGINACVLFLDSKTPVSLEESVDTEKLVQNFESNPGWSFYIDFMKWHRDRRIDLSNVSVDMAYVGSTLTLAMLEHPENVTLERLQALAKRMRDFGLPVPEVTAKTVEDFQKSASLLQSVGGSFVPALLRRLRSKSAKEVEARN